MTYYSYSGGVPTPLPFRIRLQDGSTRTDLQSCSADELLSFGFVEASPAPSFAVNEVAEWNGTAWVVRELTTGEMEYKSLMEFSKVRAERDRLLADSDKPWGLADFRANADPTTVAAWDTYRQALRDLPENVTDPFNVEWPTPPS